LPDDVISIGIVRTIQTAVAGNSGIVYHMITGLTPYSFSKDKFKAQATYYPMMLF